MSCIRSKNTGIERFIEYRLHRKGYKFSTHDSSLPGKPDIVFSNHKVVIFIDGDFWHGWHFNKWRKKLNPYWKKKIAGNIKRDRANKRRLRYRGWVVIRIWEHELINIGKVMKRITDRINKPTALSNPL